MKKNIEILMAINDAYIEPAIILITSICENHSDTIDFHFLDSRLSVTCKNRIANKVKKYGNNLTFIKIDEKLFVDAPKRKHISIETYYRLLAFEIIPDLDRVLYLDADMLAIDDIDEIWNYDLKGKCIGAVADQGDLSHEIAHKLMIGMQRDSVYVNAGMLLMDLERIRDRITVEDVLSIINAYGDELKYQDQDVINIIFEFEKEILPAKYNQTPLLEDRVEFLKYITGRDNAKPVIIHYFGEMKPWKKFYGYRFLGFYRKYCIKSGRLNILIPVILNTILRIPALLIQNIKWMIYFYREDKDLIRVFGKNHGKYERYLRNEGVSKVILYGAGIWGINVASELVETTIDILCILDKKVSVGEKTGQDDVIHFPISGITLRNPSEGLDDADLIVVSVEGKFEEIKNMFIGKKACRIQSLEDFVFMKKIAFFD